MTPDRDDAAAGDDGAVGTDDGDLDLPTLANLVHGDPDEDAIDEESPRPADDDRYGWLEGNGGDVVIFDERNPWAWISSDDPDDLDDRE